MLFGLLRLGVGLGVVYSEIMRMHELENVFDPFLTILVYTGNSGHRPVFWFARSQTRLPDRRPPQTGRARVVLY